MIYDKRKFGLIEVFRIYFKDEFGIKLDSWEQMILPDIQEELERRMTIMEKLINERETSL